MDKHYFTTLITGYLATHLGPVAFNHDSMPYQFTNELPWDYWERRGDYGFNFKEIIDGL